MICACAVFISFSDDLLEHVSSVYLFFVPTRLNLFSDANSSGKLVIPHLNAFKLVYAAANYYLDMYRY